MVDRWNPDKWIVIFENDRRTAANDKSLLTWFQDWESWISMLRALKTGAPAEMTMHVPGRPPTLTKVIYADQVTPRSTFKNPLGLPEPPQPL